jgi:hypothetical protein
MSWLVVLGLVVVLAVVAVLSGLVPRGGRPVEKTKLVQASRVVLAILALLIAWAAWHDLRG